MSIDKSSFLAQQSVLSIFQTSPKSEIQQKYQQIFKQASQYRLKIRQLKQDNQWIKTAKQGLENQCRVLKDLLGQKKQIIIQLNTQLRIANEQINRLQDMFQGNKETKELHKKQINQKDKIIQSKNQYIIKLQYQIQNRRNTIDTMMKERQNFKAQMQNKQKSFIYHIHDKVISILDLYHQSQSSHTSRSKNGKEDNIFRQIESKIQSLIQKQNRTKADYQQKLENKRLQVESWKNKEDILQLQLKEATCIVQQYQQNSKKQNRKIKQLENKIQVFQKNTKNKSKNLQMMCSKYHIYLIKFIDLLKPIVFRSNQTQMKIESIYKARQSNFDIGLCQLEINMLVEEVKQLLIKNTSERQEKVKLAIQIKEVQNRNKILQEQYDILKLKFMTLQRQFQAILDDNRRILKFNQVSRFRTDRNLKNYPNTKSYIQNSNGSYGNNKENQNIINTGCNSDSRWISKK